MIPLASMTVDQAALSAFLERFHNNAHSGELIAEEMARYSLAAVTCTSSSKNTIAMSFFKTLTTEDVRNATKESLVGAVVVLCQWMVFE